MGLTRITPGRVLAGLLTLGALVGCQAGPECPEPAYAGGTTDEAWRALLDAEGRVKQGAAQAPVVTEPGGGSVRAGEAPPTVRWTSPLAGLPPPLPVPGGRAGRSMLARAWDVVSSAVLPAAHAHGLPLTGDAYLVRLSTAGECPVEHFTTELSWTLTSEEWAQVRAGAPREVVLTVTSAEFRDNAVANGPFRPASAVSFRVEP